MYNWIIVLITLISSALLSGIEIAYITSNKLRIELEKRQGLVNAKIISGFQNNPSSLLSTIIAGNSIAIVIYSIAMTKILEPFLIQIIPNNSYTNYLLLLIQTIVSTLIILVVAEFLPKALFRINSNYVINLFAIPIYIIYYILYPFVFIVNAFSKFILTGIFGIKLKEKELAFNLGDIDRYLEEYTPEKEQGKEEKQDIKMFQNALNFHELKLRECMIPRTEIAAAEENSPIEELNKIFIESGFSKVLVYKETIDNISGYVHTSDMFANPKSIKEIKRPILFIPETMIANKLLTMFIQQRKSIGVVVDEFGGTSGMVTMEDLIEEIFGDIKDEYDTEDLYEKKISEKEFIFSGRLEIDYINEKYNLNIPESDDYETLAGFVIFHHQSIPHYNEEIVIEPFIITILQVSENRIIQLKLVRSRE